ACYGFLSLWIRNTKVSENADMAKTWATKCCPGTYKNNYQLCCGIKDKVDFKGEFTIALKFISAKSFQNVIGTVRNNNATELPQKLCKKIIIIKDGSFFCPNTAAIFTKWSIR
uniref:hypothetical protein n=1 Tax=Alistipes putredinis TaxID=28117 RepID=UPI003FD6CA93